MGYSGARGKLIYEKNLKLEISRQTSFKEKSKCSYYGSTFFVSFHVIFAKTLKRKFFEKIRKGTISFQL
jgi:hypothetical protein